MKKHALLLCAAVLVSGGLLGGCSGNVVSSGASGAVEKSTEITSTADEVEALVEASKATGWAGVKETYAGYDSEADAAAEKIDSSNVKKEILGILDTIKENLPAVVKASKSGNITAKTEKACKTIYVSAMTLKHFGDLDARDVSLYINDEAVDALYMLENLYDGMAANVDARKGEVDINRDRIQSFTDEEWKAYAASL